jgi:energy-converting hydrogenase Eha subunit F
MVAGLSKRSSANYEVPSLREAVGAIFLHKVATGKSLYPKVEGYRNPLTVYTHVQETILIWHLIVGGSDPSGVVVDTNYYARGPSCVGIAALRKF